MRINQMCIKNAQIARNNASFYRAFPEALKYEQRYEGAVQILKSMYVNPDENPELFGMTVSMIPLPDEPSYSANCRSDGFVRPDTSPYVYRIPGKRIGHPLMLIPCRDWKTSKWLPAASR